MEPPPLDPHSSDPFEGYLEVVSVLRILTAKRERVSQSLAASEISEAEASLLLDRVDGGIAEAESLRVACEQGIEESLQAAANRADSVRRLFDSVTERMREMADWINDSIEHMPEEDREEWDLLVSDYERIRDELGGDPPSPL